MPRVDYGTPAELLEIEAAASEYAQDFVGLPPVEALFNRKLPERYDISKEWDEDKDRWRRRREDILGGWTDTGFRWQITYDFPADIRPNVTDSGRPYGSANMTYRRLYLILNETLFGGVPFIDTYFETIYPGSWVEQHAESLLADLRDELVAGAEDAIGNTRVTSSGKLDQRFADTRGVRKRLGEYKSWARTWEASKGVELARLLKEDILDAVASGRLPMQTDPKASTQKRRIWAGLSGAPLLYATGSLIESVRLYVDIEGDNTWRTRQGIMV